jgi:hypothetical protein
MLSSQKNKSLKKEGKWGAPLVVILICNRFISTQAHEQAPAKEAVSSSAFCPAEYATQV